jgi:hypothetical protein
VIFGLVVIPAVVYGVEVVSTLVSLLDVAAWTLDLTWTRTHFC